MFKLIVVSVWLTCGMGAAQAQSVMMFGTPNCGDWVLESHQPCSARMQSARAPLRVTSWGS
jgi:predicted RNA-binding Zn-ribbon protein involved in translation (DUF1610 family)